MKKTSQLSLLGAKSPRRPPKKKPVAKPTSQPLIRLSPTTGLNLFADCPRCFYLHHARGVHRPRGIFPSLPSGMDLVIKSYFDNYRGALPPELEGKIDGILYKNLARLEQWRNWRTGLEYRDEQRNAILFGALDDCLTDGELFVALDYKTKGSAPGAGDGERYYQRQLDTYTLLLEANGFPAARHAYLVYYYPLRVDKHGVVTFRVHPVKVPTDPDRARTLFGRAVDLLRGGDVPQRHTNCEYCVWNEQRSEFD